MPSAISAATLNLGFMTVLHETNGYLGGYLVTNSWGRPLEFRLSSAVQPNRVQQILYGGTLQPYICAEVIGKTLIDKTAVAVDLVVTDREPVLDLRRKLQVPVVWLAPPNDPMAAARVKADDCVQQGNGRHGPLLCHPSYAIDVPGVREILNRLEGTLDLGEPFERIREALGEARKMGVTSRA